MMESSTLACKLNPSVESFPVDCGSIPVLARVSRFLGSSGANEFHLAITPVEAGDFATQLAWLTDGYEAALEHVGLDTQSAVLRRFFCSDLPNQAAALLKHPLAHPHDAESPCAVSWIGQPPEAPRKIALWAYHVELPGTRLEKTYAGSTLSLRRGGLAHHWTAGLTCPAVATAGGQTQAVLHAYEAALRGRRMSLADNAVRTWFFVRDIDVDYGMLVNARREFFAERGLTPETHFIASTGVGGAQADPATKVTLDAYASSGLQPGQIDYLSAPEHLGPTHLYGVTFERGTAIAYRDRRHLILSGTASIDTAGRIVHTGNVSRQFDRAVENVGALLQSADAGLGDLCALIAYLRDPSDHALVWRRMRETFGDIPLQVVVAPVCRPGWLIEIEGCGIVSNTNPDLPPF